MLLHTRVVFVHGTPGQTSLGTIFANQSVTLEVYFRAGNSFGGENDTQHY